MRIRGWLVVGKEIEGTGSLSVLLHHHHVTIHGWIWFLGIDTECSRTNIELSSSSFLKVFLDKGIHLFRHFGYVYQHSRTISRCHAIQGFVGLATLQTRRVQGRKRRRHQQTASVARQLGRIQTSLTTRMLQIGGRYRSCCRGRNQSHRTQSSKKKEKRENGVKRPRLHHRQSFFSVIDGFHTHTRKESDRPTTTSKQPNLCLRHRQPPNGGISAELAMDTHPMDADSPFGWIHWTNTYGE